MNQPAEIERLWGEIETLGFDRNAFRIDRFAMSDHPVSLRAQTSCRITHEPTGITVLYNQFRTYEDNLMVALELMAIYLKAWRKEQGERTDDARD